MKFTPLALEGVLSVSLDPNRDQRGFFARSFCADTFAEQGLFTQIAQINTSYTARRGTIRGIHFQRPPHAEAKLVRCVRGRIFDVAVDLRAHSPTFGKWVAEELSAETRKMLYIPEGFGHGFQALSSDVEMIYLHSTPYAPGFSGGVSFRDPDLDIRWPLPVTDVSEADMTRPGLEEVKTLFP